MQLVRSPRTVLGFTICPFRSISPIRFFTLPVKNRVSDILDYRQKREKSHLNCKNINFPQYFVMIMMDLTHVTFGLSQKSYTFALKELID